MSGMLTINIDESEVKKLCRERVEEIVKEVDAEYIFWDSTELKKNVYELNTIQDNFFLIHDFKRQRLVENGTFQFRKREVS